MNEVEKNEEASPAWFEYRRLILSELARLNSMMLILERKIDFMEENLRKDATAFGDKRDRAIRDLEVSVAMLQVKSGIWGAVAGAAVLLTTYLVEHFK